MTISSVRMHPSQRPGVPKSVTSESRPWLLVAFVQVLARGSVRSIELSGLVVPAGGRVPLPASSITTPCASFKTRWSASFERATSVVTNCAGVLRALFEYVSS